MGRVNKSNISSAKKLVAKGKKNPTKMSALSVFEEKVRSLKPVLVKKEETSSDESEDEEDDEDDVEDEEELDEDEEEDMKPAAKNKESIRRLRESTRAKCGRGTVPVKVISAKGSKKAKGRKVIIEDAEEYSDNDKEGTQDQRKIKKTVNTGRGKTNTTETNSTTSNIVAVANSSVGTSPNNVVNRSLASFGFRAAPTGSGGTRPGRRNGRNSSILRVVILDGIEGRSDIILRCEPTNEGTNISSWSEKILADVIKEPESWATDLNISNQCFNWYVKNTLQLNGNGFPIRLFHIPVIGKTSEEELFALCNHICELVNNTPKNRERLYVNRQKLFWMRGPVVWSDLIGIAEAVEEIRFHKGTIYDGFYEQHEEFILTYFKSEDVRNIGALFGSNV
jgi:hypothetical protein